MKASPVVPPTRVSPLTASPLSFPNLGDESVAVRFNVTSASADFGFDLIGIGSGTTW
jgi:hypothetical protein